MRSVTTDSQLNNALSGVVEETCQQQTYTTSHTKTSQTPDTATRGSGVLLLLMLLLFTTGLYAGGYFERLRMVLAGPVDSYFSNAGIILEKIIIKGQNRVADKQILKALGISTGQSLFGFNAAKAQDELAGIGLVKSARVMRMLPSTLLVEIEERTPFARWLHGGKIELIDKDGIVLRGLPQEHVARYPLVVGEGAAGRAESLVRLLSVHQGLALELKMAKLVSGRRWNLHAKSGAIIQLSENDLAIGLARFVRLSDWRGLLKQSDLVVDLRAPDRAFMRIERDGARQSGRPSRLTRS